MNDTATTEIYTLSLHDALDGRRIIRSEEHTSELQSHSHLVCRLLLEKKHRCGAFRRRHYGSQAIGGAGASAHAGGQPPGEEHARLFFSDWPPTDIYTFPLPAALPI